MSVFFPLENPLAHCYGEQFYPLKRDYFILGEAINRDARF